MEQTIELGSSFGENFRRGKMRLERTPKVRVGTVKKSIGGDGFTMLTQRRRPSFSRPRISRGFPHRMQHSSLRNIEAQHLQLAVDSLRTPGRVLGNNAKDEIAQFFADASSPNTSPV
jgi:hypothetical protein